MVLLGAGKVVKELQQLNKPRKSWTISSERNLLQPTSSLPPNKTEGRSYVCFDFTFYLSPSSSCSDSSISDLEDDSMATGKVRLVSLTMSMSCTRTLFLLDN